jgi:hypothetical protein
MKAEARAAARRRNAAMPRVGKAKAKGEGKTVAESAARRAQRCSTRARDAAASAAGFTRACCGLRYAHGVGRAALE